jgi:hypothetical protein
MSVLGDIGNAILGTDVTKLQEQANEAADQLRIAISTMIALEAILALELFLLVVMQWKERH